MSIMLLLYFLYAIAPSFEIMQTPFWLFWSSIDTVAEFKNFQICRTDFLQCGFRENLNGNVSIIDHWITTFDKQKMIVDWIQIPEASVRAVLGYFPLHSSGLSTRFLETPQQQTSVRTKVQKFIKTMNTITPSLLSKASMKDCEQLLQLDQRQPTVLFSPTVLELKHC